MSHLPITRVLFLAFVVLVSPIGRPAVSAQSTKLSQSARVFVSAWQEIFAGHGKTFPAPRFVAFEGSFPGTGCGTIAEGNAYFCPPDNAIYYDVRFLRSMSQAAGRITGTDGDYAPIAILGHELGHAVSTHLQPSANLRQRLHYRVNGMGQERLADCLSGAVTRDAEVAGLLERSDIAEALAAVRIAGTPDTQEPTLRLWIARHSQDHPAPQVRQDAFRLGYERGALSCGDVLNMLRAPAGGRN